jgi:rhodanese-related sulfurtransferase
MHFIGKGLERSGSMNVNVVLPEELKRIHERGETIELIDVRTPAEYHEAHVAFARNVPLERLDQIAGRAESGEARAKPLYVVCRSGSRGKEACRRLIAAGYAEVVNVEGGTLACEKTGLPMVRGKRAISLERQVRIAAGSLVLLGAVLGLLVHPYWIALAAFIGAGLVFSGITDTCGMALLLARMPWNQVDLVATDADPGRSASSNAA